MQPVNVVKSDLQWLVREFEHGTREHDDLRRSAAVVRRLIVDGVLQQARRALRAEGQPRLDVYPLSQVLDLNDLSNVEMAAAAGCRIQRRLIGPFSVGSHVIPAPSPPVVTPLPLPDFLKSPCLVARGVALSRRDVVKYVANKLGGVHFDNSRNRKGDELFERLEELDELVIVRPISVVDVSLLAIIQAMISSASVMHPFGLQEIDLVLDVPLQNGRRSIELPKRARLAMNLLGDDDIA